MSVIARKLKVARVAETMPEAYVSYEDFLRWDGENQHLEWIDGKVIPMAAVTDEHSLLNGFILNTITPYVEHHELGKIFYDPFQMKTGPELPGRAPDILFVARRNLRRLKRLFLDGPADLVIEIVSQGSKATDRIHKYREYELGGVKEYWLLDPLAKSSDFFVRNRRGKFETIAVANGVFDSKVIEGLWYKIDWFWKRPKVTYVLKQWKLV